MEEKSIIFFFLLCHNQCLQMGCKSIQNCNCAVFEGKKKWWPTYFETLLLYEYDMQNNEIKAMKNNNLLQILLSSYIQTFEKKLFLKMTCNQSVPNNNYIKHKFFIKLIGKRQKNTSKATEHSERKIMLFIRVFKRADSKRRT